MEQSPMVTILLPNYNNASYLKECIESILGQTFQDFKLLIIDDGSTDNSIEIIRSYNDDRFELVLKEKNSGIVDSLNMGLDRINTKYVVRLDGDDLMSSDRIEILVNFMESHPEYGICGSDIQVFGADDFTMEFESDWQKNNANLIFFHSVGHASLIFRSSLFVEQGFRYSNEFKFMEDYDLLYRLKTVAKSTSIPRPLYFYRYTERHEPVASLEKKRLTYQRFYERILTDLGIDYPESDEIHLEISKNVKPKRKLLTYKRHLNLVEKANDEKKLFPQKELKQVLKEYERRLVYRLADESNLSTAEALRYPFVWKYAIKAKSRKK